MKYRVINVDSIPFLEERIANYISEGWILQGGICILVVDSKLRYYQAVIKNL